MSGLHWGIGLDEIDVEASASRIGHNNGLTPLNHDAVPLFDDGSCESRLYSRVPHFTLCEELLAWLFSGRRSGNRKPFRRYYRPESGISNKPSEEPLPLSAHSSG